MELQWNSSEMASLQESKVRVCACTPQYCKHFLSGLVSLYAHENRAGYFSSLHAAEACFFFPRPPLNEGETEGYVKLTAEEIAVKRSQHFFFLPECFSSPVLPVVVAFSRHPDPQKTFY